MEIYNSRIDISWLKDGRGDINLWSITIIGRKGVDTMWP